LGGDRKEYIQRMISKKFVETLQEKNEDLISSFDKKIDSLKGKEIKKIKK